MFVYGWVNGGQRMTHEEIAALIDELDKALTQARMIRMIADDVYRALYKAQGALALLDGERRINHESME